MSKHKSPENFPPRFADRFLRWYCHPDLIEEIQGDLYEDFRTNLKQASTKKANRIFIWHVLLFFRLSNIKKITLNFSTVMWRNYFKVSFRNMLKYKGFTLLNTLGLSVGLATALLILLWIQDEVSFDKYHEHDTQLYRVMRNMFLDGGEVVTTGAVPYPLAAELEDNFPEVISADVFSWEIEMVVTSGQNTFRQAGRFAGEDYFESLSHPFLAGDPKTALEQPNSVVISDQLAQQLYGSNWQNEADIIGTGLKVGTDSFSVFNVTGVYTDVPQNSTFRYDLILPSEIHQRNNSWVDSWTNNGYRLVVRLRSGTDIESFNRKIKGLITEHAPDEEVDLFVQAYSDMHLYSQFENGSVTGGRITYVRIFGLVAIFILLIAGINFMNLSTARSSKRAKEIGVRKTIGATPGDLVNQFISESTLLTAVSMVLAIVLTLVLLPSFNSLTNKAIGIAWANPMTWLVLFSLLIIVGVFSGSYPAFFLSSFPILDIIKGKRNPKAGYTNVRRGLVIFQFILSNLLIISTITCYRQIQFIKNKNLGYKKENVIHFPIEGTLAEEYEIIKERALQHPSILSVSAASELPTDVGWSTGGVQWEGRDPTSNIEINIIAAQFDFVETMQMEVLDGRVHGREYALDSANLVVNEAAARIMGMDNPIGEKVSMWGDDGQIIGLVKDFHFSSMYSPIDPLVIKLDEVNPRNLFVRLSGEDMEGAIAHLEDLTKEINPQFPFSYGFLDEAYANTYRSESIVGSLARYFSIIAIFLSCLGLFGLAIFAAEQRYKEISIRKVLGASMSNLIVLLTKEFLLLVLVAFAIAVPLAWYISKEWLSDFAYSTSIGVGVFLTAGLATLIIAFLTVSYEAMKAALNNPIEALNKE